MKPIVTLTAIRHRGMECIALHFEVNFAIQTALQNTGLVKFSRSHKCWYAALCKENYTAIATALKGHASMDKAALQHYLQQKKKRTLQKEATPATANTVVKQVEKVGQSPEKQAVFFYKNHQIAAVNMHVLTNMAQCLKLKAYSPSTMKTYLNEVSHFLQVLQDKPADNLTPEQLKRYLVYCFEKLKLKENTLHSKINALKFYYEQILGREKFFREIPRPKKALQLPNVMGEKEITRLFNAVNNLKHKAILFTAYSAGLRVSEVVHLKLKDIDSDRMQIKIEASKGKKDRFVNLSPILLDVLRSYIKNCKRKPTVYLFEREIAGEPYSSRSAQKVFQRARHTANISKNISFHSLRHSFATHLLEKGIDIRYIKDILGHFDLKTTERYTHVSRDKLIQVTSPLDDLWLKGEIH